MRDHKIDCECGEQHPLSEVPGSMLYKAPTWFSRWKRYPMSIVGHIAQGAASVGLVVLGVLADFVLLATVAAMVWFVGFIAYQFGSGMRKAVNKHKTDTIGLDIFDYVIGFVLTTIILMAAVYLLAV